MEYLKCMLNEEEEIGDEVTISGIKISKVEKSKYLGSVTKCNGEIKYDISHCIRVEWQK